MEVSSESRAALAVATAKPAERSYANVEVTVLVDSSVELEPQVLEVVGVHVEEEEDQVEEEELDHVEELDQVESVALPHAIPAKVSIVPMQRLAHDTVVSCF